MSAIIPEDGEGHIEVVKVLFTLHPGFDSMDFVGPLEVLSHARHNKSDPGKSLDSLCLTQVILRLSEHRLLTRSEHRLQSFQLHLCRKGRAHRLRPRRFLPRPHGLQRGSQPLVRV